MKGLKRPLLSFVVFSYVIFLVFLLIIGITMLLGAPESIVHLLQIISAWSSTFAFLILFKRIYPEISLKDFLRKQFSTRIRFSVLGTAVIIQIIIITVTVFLLSNTNDSVNLAVSATNLGILLLAFLDTLFWGPLGEELGWRGYALNELQKKNSPLKSAVIVGVLWGFWHAPLWFASGYTGLNVIKYMVLFMIGILSFSIIVTFFYNLNKNLVIPIIIHLLFNYSLVLIKGDLLDVLEYFMLCYFVVALMLIVWNPRGVLYKR